MGGFKMTEKAIFEIGDIIHVKRSMTFKKLTSKEIQETYEYKKFKEHYPEICKLAEAGQITQGD